ncbi:hypothetical protein Y032_0009g545 [Ancylostoma ceylanicum]|uniref:Cystatin domain-containing protein n=1 Tax=Ancylostoma ceylanicum TaxID=53326 RepID=A0A016VJE7_9BILA|nr:hypothetical protein Y032_0009g545 [Ancylostoma ceylanicum]
MRILILILAACAFVVTSPTCVDLSKITKNDIDNSHFVGKIEVIESRKENHYTVYKVKFKRFYHSRVNVLVLRWLLHETYYVRQDCPSLQKGEDYIACCTSVYRCEKARPYDNLTLEEWRLL